MFSLFHPGIPLLQLIVEQLFQQQGLHTHQMVQEQWQRVRPLHRAPQVCQQHRHMEERMTSKIGAARTWLSRDPAHHFVSQLLVGRKCTFAWQTPTFCQPHSVFHTSGSPMPSGPELSQPQQLPGIPGPSQHFLCRKGIPVPSEPGLGVQKREVSIWPAWLEYWMACLVDKFPNR